ncbi:DUF934 domain-containing protein [Swingsia samuiensis]|uniref:DUF934 domain-containing protein n=1 Tax=Swingsia samuiensis TaxID=1293412 RepID=A0A4Y6UIC9_9PROT|nr:DUF934 domain-containing protein [Swingsia samuiensis]QDH16804.1 DUF934 domain-containing protein [Swingsia samuiensis]
MKLFDLGERSAKFHETLVSLQELAENGEARAVLLENTDDVADLKPYLNRLELVVVQFPIFRDGRAFTQARELREYHHYTGEIRAEGHILPDQADFFKRCGVDSVVLPEGSDPELWKKQIERYAMAYQRSVLPEPFLGRSMRVKQED